MLSKSGCSSVVERDLAKVDVESSNLFTRSIQNLDKIRPRKFKWGFFVSRVLHTVHSISTVYPQYIHSCPHYFSRTNTLFFSYNVYFHTSGFVKMDKALKLYVEGFM